ncbi:MAG: hypothetical protein A3E85_01030 [Gammaproteobacteria bacterium RIFCSPHIGHO2_12_FULL_45_12]|nr:MAG: hypothetical protein A3E85_01030 [Gammaproteobacteria bacterium RIFCSPHIGHO2_12_FULL_45_12]
MTTVETGTFYNPDSRQLICRGEWDVTRLPELQALLDKASWPIDGDITINGESLDKLDSAGAWLLVRRQKKLEEQGVTSQLTHFSRNQAALLSLVQHQIKSEANLPFIQSLNWVQTIGRHTLLQFSGFTLYVNFIGRLTVEMLRIARHPQHIRFRSLVSVIYRNGFQAIPIVTLLSFMIGIVLTYQMGLQLRNYGANIFIVDLLGLSILREFAPLLTAIMVAGRTGSAYTAQLGMMKINQEIDALDTMGVTPAELLLLPRMAGLLIALPLLTMWADIMGIFGGMVMAQASLDVSWYDFLHRFPTVIPLKTLLIGLVKTPVFALIIASIGCFQGMQVESNADSVGQNTTKSVVLSIFFIIVADAIFSILFSWLKI